MRGDWSMNDLAVMARTFLYFTPPQCERLQQEVLSRLRDHATPLEGEDSERGSQGAFKFTAQQAQ